MAIPTFFPFISRKCFPLTCNNYIATLHGTGTHTIQLSVHEDESSMQINITFARNSSARGAQVILKPEILNDSTCSNLIIINLEKMDDSISTTIKDILRGTYNIKIYTLNHNGIPESHAEPGAVKKEIFQGTSKTTIHTPDCRNNPHTYH